MKLLVFTSILLFSGCLSFSQDKKWVGEDINRDGISDSICVFYDGGTGFGGWYLKMINGKTQEILEMDIWSCFCRTKSCVLIPPAFLKPQNKAFLDRAKKELFREERTVADPALQWIIDGQLSLMERRMGVDFNLDENFPFQLLFKYRPVWLDSIPEHSDYYLALDTNTLKKIYSTDGDTPDFFNDQNLTGGVLMNSTILGNYSAGATLISGENEFYASAHSVVVKRKNKWSYAFVTDYGLTGAPNKMRWPSVKQIFVQGDYLVVRHSQLTDDIERFFVVNFIEGKCAELNRNCTSEDIVELRDGVFLVNGTPVLAFKEIAAKLTEYFQD